MDNKLIIQEGNIALGIEFGSTRIKSVLTDLYGNILASGDFTWENQFKDGYWTYDLDIIDRGLRESYASLKRDVKDNYGISLTKFKGLGISAMMHGYLAFDENDNLLVPFRTWRNSTAANAAKKLTEVFNFNVPARYSISHLYQAIIDNEEHVGKISYFTTLAGYIHYRLTGEKVLGIGDASGMFPIDSKTKQYDEEKLSKFDSLIAEKGYKWKLKDILPKIKLAGEDAGRLSKEGIAFIGDKDIEDLAGVCIVAPPEGDAGTGMTATNSVRKKTGNVSAGTSVFAMVVMENALKGVHGQIDIVTTPMGESVAMVHCNNCTSDINAWAGVFAGFLKAMGVEADMGKVYTAMFASALSGAIDGGNITSYNYFSGEDITKLSSGRPIVVRGENADFTFENFMRVNLYSAVATLRIGLEILEKENVKIDKMIGHGGFFKTPKVGNVIMSQAMKAPVTTLETAGEGGSYGMALLTIYDIKCLLMGYDKPLEEYLDDEIFAGSTGVTIEADESEIKGFDIFMERYVKGLEIEKICGDILS